MANIEPDKEWTKDDFTRADRMDEIMPDVVEAFKLGHVREHP